YRLARQTVSLCVVHASVGHLTKARELCDEGGRIFIQAHDREGEAYRLLNIAMLDLDLGHLEGAADELERGRAMHVEIKHASGVANADEGLARVAWLEGRLADADAGYEKAYREASAEAGLVAEIALERARLAFDRASPAEAARLDGARKAV